VVLVVTSNECPFAQDYEDRIIAFAKKYATGEKARVALVAISVSLEPDDRPEKMKERAKEKGFTFPYLHDETQAIGRALGASTTPEFFLLDKDRKIVYTGAMDDHSKVAKVKVKYLEDAVNALLEGKKIAVAETRPIGCAVEYKRVKK